MTVLIEENKVARTKSVTRLTPAVSPVEEYIEEDDINRWRPEWHERAACAGLTPDVTFLDLFFPGRGESARAAKKLCARCPVQTECLDYAVTNSETWGVWGGTTERERREIRKRRGIYGQRAVQRARNR